MIKIIKPLFGEQKDSVGLCVHANAIRSEKLSRSATGVLSTPIDSTRTLSIWKIERLEYKYKAIENVPAIWCAFTESGRLRTELVEMRTK